jgi:cell division protein FtsQ
LQEGRRGKEGVKRSAQAIRSWRAGRQGAVSLARSWLVSRRARIIALSIVGAGLLLGGAWLWFRDSTLVAVQQVTVTGETGPDAGAIRSALVASARSMTTLDVQTSRLYSAVSAFPVVRSLRVTAQFPHGMRIRVIEQLPVAQVVVAGRRIAVAPDGTLLRDLASPGALPRIELAAPPGGPRLSDPRALESLAAARAAPGVLRSRISSIGVVAGGGLIVRLRGGPAVYLGDATQLSAKWAAAVAVLGDPGSAGTSYIDVTDPRRPAAGAVTTSTASRAASPTSGGG